MALFALFALVVFAVFLRPLATLSAEAFRASSCSAPQQAGDIRSANNVLTFARNCPVLWHLA